jgi:hypothetical protein
LPCNAPAGVGVPDTIERMTTDDIRTLHAAAWNRLYELVKERNKLLRDLAARANFAADLTPATGMLGEFDIVQAKGILARLNAMTFMLDAALDELNGYAKQIAKPIIERKRLQREG